MSARMSDYLYARPYVSVLAPCHHGTSDGATILAQVLLRRPFEKRVCRHLTPLLVLQSENLLCSLLCNRDTGARFEPLQYGVHNKLSDWLE